MRCRGSQATKRWRGTCSSIRQLEVGAQKRYVNIEIDEMILFYCKSKRSDPHIPSADTFPSWGAAGPVSNGHRVINHQRFRRGVIEAITSSPRHITIDSGPSKQVINVKSISIHSNTSKTVVWQGERWERGLFGCALLYFLPFYFTFDSCHRLQHTDNRRWQAHPMHNLLEKTHHNTHVDACLVWRGWE
jgi:hypothetical protein